MTDLMKQNSVRLNQLLSQTEDFMFCELLDLYMTVHGDNEVDFLRKITDDFEISLETLFYWREGVITPKSAVISHVVDYMKREIAKYEGRIK